MATTYRFTFELLFRLLEIYPRGLSQQEFKWKEYGIGRSTTYKVLRNLRDAGHLVMADRQWSLSEATMRTLKRIHCENCVYPRMLQRQHQKRSEELAYKAAHPI